MAIAVDFDGTLVEYHGWVSDQHVGKPIEPMMERLRKWIEDGEEVWIFTARVSGDILEGKRAYDRIKRWCKENDLPELPVTCIKQKRFREFWDDRAIRIHTNTGERCCEGE